MDKEIKKGLMVSSVLTALFLIVAVGLLAFYFYTNLYPFSDINVISAGKMRAEIQVKTRVPTKYKVEYGTSDLYLNETQVTTDYATQHESTISGLIPEKQHFIRVVAYDQSGKEYRSKFFTL